MSVPLSCHISNSKPLSAIAVTSTTEFSSSPVRLPDGLVEPPTVEDTVSVYVGCVRKVTVKLKAFTPYPQEEVG